MKKLFMFLIEELLNELTNSREVSRNRAMNEIRAALKSHDKKTLDKYPASFVLGVVQNKI